MQFVCRPLAPKETDYELLWLIVSLGGLGLAAAWLTLDLPWPICLFHLLTGHPCPTCGATRAAIAFFHGQFAAAWTWNPLFFLVLCTVALFDVYAFVALVTRSRRLRIVRLTTLEKNFARAAVVVLFAINWAYLLAHTRNYA